MPFGMMSPLLAASDFWMAKWLTPFWFVGAGIVIGFAALAAFLLIFSLLMVPMKGLEKQRKDGTLHYIAAGITLLLGAGIGYFLRSGEIGQAFLVKGEFATEEWLLVSFAATAMTGVIVWALLFCSSSRFFGELRSLLFEGVGFAMIIVLAAVAAIGLAATPWIEKPAEAFASIPQFFSPQSTFKEYTVAGAKTPEDRKLTKIEVQYDPATLGVVRIESNRRVILADASEIEKLKFAAVTIDADAPKLWERSMGPTKCPLPLVGGAEVYVQNEEIDDATLTISIQSYPTVPQSLSILLTAIFVTVFGLLFFLMQGAGPKTAAIALSAAKSELSQPLPKILIAIVGLAILLFVFLPFHTFGEDIKLLKDCGVTLTLIAAIFQAVWSASTSVSDEIEGRTALTLLSKPIHRRSFILGKIFGVFWIVMLMFLVLGSFELFAVAYKPIVEARENSTDAPLWQVCHAEMFQTIPGLALAFMQSVVLGAISVAIGTRVSMIANFSICFSIYVLGHLTPVIMESTAGGLPLVEFFSQLISAVVPNLNLFTMESAIDADVSIPWSVIASVFIYTSIYGIGATLLGLLLFEERDLA
jgi:ABC-type transport system involved in multi-copper enzyme maturation permease subunit